MLADSGRLQEEEAEYAARKKYSKHDPPLALYTEADALAIHSLGRDRRLVVSAIEHDAVRNAAPGALMIPVDHRGVADVAAIREAVGSAAEILVDVHTRLDPADAISFCRQLEPFQPFFVEDPIRMENFDSYRKLARHIHVPLAAGEQYATKSEFRQQIEEDLEFFIGVDALVGAIGTRLGRGTACH